MTSALGPVPAAAASVAAAAVAAAAVVTSPAVSPSFITAVVAAAVAAVPPPPSAVPLRAAPVASVIPTAAALITPLPVRPACLLTPRPSHRSPALPLTRLLLVLSFIPFVNIPSVVLTPQATTHHFHVLYVILTLLPDQRLPGPLPSAAGLFFRPCAIVLIIEVMSNGDLLRVMSLTLVTSNSRFAAAGVAGARTDAGVDVAGIQGTSGVV